MIKGTGIDAVKIERVKKLSDAFIDKYYSSDEIEEYRALSTAHEDVRAQFLASRFAVKEAYAKARGTGFCSNVIPCEISTVHDEKGKPYIKLSGTTLQNSVKEKISVSITHEDPLAIAMVIIEEV